MYTHVQGNSKVIPQHAIRAHGIMELQLRPFLTSTESGSTCNWPALCTVHITPENEPHYAFYVEVWLCPLRQCEKPIEYTDSLLLLTIQPGFVASFPHSLVSLILSV
jgi:hypothetical protein